MLSVLWFSDGAGHTAGSVFLPWHWLLFFSNTLVPPTGHFSGGICMLSVPFTPSFVTLTSNRFQPKPSSATVTDHAASPSGNVPFSEAAECNGLIKLLCSQDRVTKLTDLFPTDQVSCFRSNRPAANCDAVSSPIGLTPFDEKMDSFDASHRPPIRLHAVGLLWFRAGPAPFNNRPFSFSSYRIPLFM
jgi:hypothetical protein